FVEALVEAYPVISGVQKHKVRHFHQETAAQCVLLEVKGEGSTLTDKYLVELYEEESDFDHQGETAQHLREALGFLDRALAYTLQQVDNHPYETRQLRAHAADHQQSHSRIWGRRLSGGSRPLEYRGSE
ncbi:MAG: hypothetical protein AAF125_08695, partial [Chloroflexota bacterium]